MTWMTSFIVACCLLLISSLPVAADQCRLCHSAGLVISGTHAGQVGNSCQNCHKSGNRLFQNPASRSHNSSGCLNCHQGYQAIYNHPMATRTAEKDFVDRSYRRVDRNFWQKNCNQCHLQSCGDCHGSGHEISRPSSETCSRCHKGYFTGWDYLGRAPRDEHDRYQRGSLVEGETFLKMLPDIHHQRGMVCGDCHTMQSLLAGKKSARLCTDCHTPDSRVIEHRIAAHLEKMECVACHAAWAAQEYGSFYLHYTGKEIPEPFDALQIAGPGYIKSSYLKRQDLPPLGLNSQGRVAPIRPQFIAYYSRIGTGWFRQIENRLLAAEWRAFTPHTIQRGTVMCDGCHDNQRRFLLEPPEKRIYDLTRDGLGLYSFWNRSGQRMTNGSFMDQARYSKMSIRTNQYKRLYVEKWRQLSRPEEISSQP